ncbi:hypothetical protein X975_06455, partial [Stegodyphus mimosarum]
MGTCPASLRGTYFSPPVVEILAFLLSMASLRVLLAI